MSQPAFSTRGGEQTIIMPVVQNQRHQELHINLETGNVLSKDAVLYYRRLSDASEVPSKMNLGDTFGGVFIVLLRYYDCGTPS